MDPLRLGCGQCRRGIEWPQLLLGEQIIENCISVSLVFTVHRLDQQSFNIEIDNARFPRQTSLGQSKGQGRWRGCQVVLQRREHAPVFVMGISGEAQRDSSRRNKWHRPTGPVKSRLSRAEQN